VGPRNDVFCWAQNSPVAEQIALPLGGAIWWDISHPLLRE